MFETQDLLPRQSPIPSAVVSQLSIKPMVPEVSIIVGKPSTNARVIPTPMSYAVWKNHNLPRVTFPPNLSDEARYLPSENSVGCITSRSNVFPLRTVTVSTSSPDSCITTSNSCLPEKSLCNVVEYPRTRILTSSPTSYLTRSTHKTDQRSDAIDVLTICASTQTDTRSVQETTFELFRQELSQLSCVIKELREEQCQMRKVFEAMLLQNHQTKQRLPTDLHQEEKSTQYESENINATPSTTDMLEESKPSNIVNRNIHFGIPNVQIYSPVTNDTPEPCVPVMQSSTGKSNTILNKKQNKNQLAHFTKSDPKLRKPSTERSIVMNELAMKYLPAAKLTELMQKVQVTTAATPPKRTGPCRENDQVYKMQTDISNASYKYLSKYKLLPKHNDNLPIQNGDQRLLHQQTAPDSPLDCDNDFLLKSVGPPHLDLDHIRRQPKFL